MGLQDFIIKQGIKYILGGGGDSIKKMLGSDDPSAVKSLLETISGGTVTDEETGSFIPMARAALGDSEDGIGNSNVRADRDYERRKRDILGSPKEYIVDTGMNVLSEGLHGASGIVKNNVNRLAETILSGYGGTTADQESRYGVDKFSNVMKGVAANKIRKGEAISSILDSLGNVVDSSYGNYKANKDRANVLSLMENPENKLPAAAYDYFSTNERLRRGAKRSK